MSRTRFGGPVERDETDRSDGLDQAIDIDWSEVLETSTSEVRAIPATVFDAAVDDRAQVPTGPPDVAPPSGDDTEPSDAHLDREELRALVESLAATVHGLRDEVADLRAEAAILRVSVGYLRRHGAANSDVATLRTEMREIQDRLGLDPVPPPPHPPLPEGLDDEG